MNRLALVLLSLWLALAPAGAQLGGGYMFPGPGSPAASGGAAAVVYTGNSTTNTGTSSVPILSVNIGTASSDRYVACSISGAKSGGLTASGLTINGAAASLVIAQGNSANEIELWIAAVPTGSGAQSITWTWSGASLGAGAACWALTGLTNSGAYTSRVSGTTSGANLTLTSISAGGVIVGAGGTNTSSCVSAIWTGTSASNDYCMAPYYDNAGAHNSFAAAQTNYNVTFTEAGTFYAAVAASFR